MSSGGFCHSENHNPWFTLFTTLRKRRVSIITALAAMMMLSSCGGGGGGGGGGSTGAAIVVADGWQQGVFEPSSDFIDRCENPRSGIDPGTGFPYPDTAGTTLDENNFLRSWSDETYLWYSEIIDRDPGLYANTKDYFDLLVTEELTASGTPKDSFHWHIDTQEWNDYANNTPVDYGLEFSLLADLPPRKLLVAYVNPGSQAESPEISLARGAEVLEIDGVDFVNDPTQAGVDVLVAGMYPSEEGETHQFKVRYFGSDTERTVTLTAMRTTPTLVQNIRTIETPSGNVGYMAFHSHLYAAEKELVEAVEQLQAGGISDLVLDMRYNGGGSAGIASQLAYMIAGVNATAGRAFETIQFNDKHPDINPVTGQPIEPIPFLNETQGYSLPAGQGLPTLDLQRVFILAGNNTCSASEAVINALRGIDIEVIQIGGTTCGKPYGYYPQDNCGTTYFTIQLRGINDKGFGDYADGFSPADDPKAPGVGVPGCTVEDDYGHALGDVEEKRLATALSYRETGSCPEDITAANAIGDRDNKRRPINDGTIQRPEWHSIRVYR